MSTITESPATVTSLALLDIPAIRAQFPILGEMIHGKPLVYLDNAATTQKPLAVIEAMNRYYLHTNANVHRGVHTLSQRATTEFENARRKVQHFINAAKPEEVIFVRGCTEAINLVASSYGTKFIKTGDEIVISYLEHHSNIVPWQMLCERTGALLKVIPMNDAGELDMAAYEALLSDRTKLVSVVHVSNALGTINPVATIIELAHRHGAVVLIDGAQAVPHTGVDVQALDADFYTFSSHKMYGPTGIGVLYGKKALLESMPPVQGGGDMILSVTFEKTTYNKLPYKLEAGTPAIAEAIGLGAAVDYLQGIGMAAIAAYEADLLAYGTEVLSQIPGVRLIGTAKEKAGVLSFVIENIHPHDIGTILDHDGLAVRAGHHCAQPVMDRLKVPATARASFAFYNTREEIDALAAGIRRVIEVFG
ncbi:MAG: cysteine desulfurase [Candidatus Sericytochromatia bacterium]|nr:cysteine desulfurase [Candidatus Sericytochromatia bacterium]